MFYKFLPFLILLGCGNNPSVNNMQKKTLEIFDIQGHRGCRGLFPENTIPAMLHALELGVTTLEMDAVITKDSMVILSHEPFFNHEIATKPNGDPVKEEEEKGLNIYLMNYADVQKFDIGLLPHPRFPEQEKMAVVKPLLSDVFAAVSKWCAENNKPLPFFNIETKSLPGSDNAYHPAPAQFVDLLMQVIHDAGMEKQTNLQSFDFRTLIYARKAWPEVRLAALVEPDDTGTLETHLETLGFVPEIYSPAWELVNEALVQACKQKGMLLIPWTVNDTATATRLKALGVDGLITDYPDRVR